MENIVKNQIVKTILSNSSKEDICGYFKIGAETNIEKRLNQFNKAKLFKFVNHIGKKLKNALENQLKNYPLKSAPTLYLVNISNFINFKDLKQKTIKLENRGRNVALELPQDRVIRKIYMRRSLKIILGKPVVYEFILGYEKRIEITNWDPEKDDYGKSKYVYTLENALVWFPKDNKKFSIIACNDFPVVKPIINYLNSNFNLEACLPDLSEKMLKNLSEGSTIRNATFSKYQEQNDEDLDVRTITVYDSDLQNRKLFKEISTQNSREQRSGYYSNHPDILRAGLGITRRYGRIWTPAHLNREELIRLILGVVVKLDLELERISKSNTIEYVNFYLHKPVYIGSKTPLNSQSKKIFEMLIRYFIDLSKKKIQKEIIKISDIKQIVEYKTKLGLYISMTYECPNCGTRKITCKKCNGLIEVTLKNSELIGRCPECKELFDFENFKCDCGEHCPILDPYSQLIIIPSTDLLNAIDRYLNQLSLYIKPYIFIIVGTQFILIKSDYNRKKKPKCRRIKLEELKYWNLRARLNLMNSEDNKKIISLLNKLKEKCSVNGGHPCYKDCDRCISSMPTRKKLEKGEVCLLRAFGIPINKKFDGIHHGHEMTDVVYSDQFEDEDVKIGIHFKSKSRSNKQKGLGRTNYKVRELYTQTYYTLYMIIRKKIELDILGICIPNRISEDVIQSIESVLFKFGISSLVIDYDCWVRIMKRVKEEIELEQKRV
ncbi:hypothetical protein ES705_18433 [subsurface metagenome]